MNFTPTLLAEAEAAWKRRAAQPAPAKKRRGGRKHPVPRPFLKWVGGKGHLVPELKRRIPRDFDGTYHEPFVGGGALFFALQPDRAHLSDNNLRLVRTYRAIRDDVDAVIARLEQLPHDKELFLQLRREPIDECPDDATVAAATRPLSGFPTHPRQQPSKTTPEPQHGSSSDGWTLLILLPLVGRSVSTGRCDPTPKASSTSVKAGSPTGSTTISPKETTPAMSNVSSSPETSPGAGSASPTCTEPN